MYHYYYSTTNLESVKNQNLKTAKEAGFKSASVKTFIPHQSLSRGYYTIEIMVSQSRLPKNDPIVLLEGVEREKMDGNYYYTYGMVKTLEEAVELRKSLEKKGIKNAVIQKK